ncbi:hypothetical protein [Streptomyces asoensis]|uniref:Uncharacterized protein n=1 Tax=Streptomyces asoensis TaxID=249586 RepID=A0ABQ3SA82_9ACTN|nr:hypothetical protein [Streptomyces asoensis]GGR00616.1 hypothetical protein GCM10010496_77210 [Streptomyces asoensis]GHI65019.1 hypothetical protein Saso_66690 [Streptomyces asoensis]
MSAPPTGGPPEESASDGPRARRARAARTGVLRRLLRPRDRTVRPQTAPRHDTAPDLDDCRRELARWQRHADSFERELTRVSFERAHLLAWLAALHPSSAVVAPAAGAGPDGTHLLRLVAGGRQLSWRLPPRDIPLFAHVPYTERATGHLSRDGPAAAEQAAHIRSHTRLLALEGTLFAAPAPARGRPQAGPAEH